MRGGVGAMGAVGAVGRLGLRGGGVGLRAVLGVGGRGHRRGGTEINDNVLMVDCDDFKKKLRIVPVDSTTEFDMKKHVQQWIYNAIPANSLEKAPGTPFYVRDLLPILVEHSQVRVISPTGLVDTGIMFPITGTTQTQGILYFNGKDESSIRYGLIYDLIDKFKRLGFPEDIAKRGLDTTSDNIQKAYTHMIGAVEIRNKLTLQRVKDKCLSMGFSQEDVEHALQTCTRVMKSVLLLDYDTLVTPVLNILIPEQPKEPPMIAGQKSIVIEHPWPLCNTGDWWTGDCTTIPSYVTDETVPSQAGYLFADAVQWKPILNRQSYERTRLDKTTEIIPVTIRYFIKPSLDVKLAVPSNGVEDAQNEYEKQFYEGIQWERNQLQHNKDFFTGRMYDSEKNPLTPFPAVIAEIRRFQLSTQVQECANYNTCLWIAEARGNGACYYNSLIPQILYQLYINNQTRYKSEKKNIKERFTQMKAQIDECKQFDHVLSTNTDGYTYSQILFDVWKKVYADNNDECILLYGNIERILNLHKTAELMLKYVQISQMESVFYTLVQTIKHVNFLRDVLHNVNAESETGANQFNVLSTQIKKKSPYEYIYINDVYKDKDLTYNCMRIPGDDNTYICTSTKSTTNTTQYNHTITERRFYNYKRLTQLTQSKYDQFVSDLCIFVNGNVDQSGNVVVIQDKRVTVTKDCVIDAYNSGTEAGLRTLWDLILQAKDNERISHYEEGTAELPPEAQELVGEINKTYDNLVPVTEWSQPSEHAHNIVELFGIPVCVFSVGLIPDLQLPITVYERIPNKKTQTYQFKTLIDAYRYTKSPMCITTQTGEDHYDMVFLKNKNS